jgi:DUF971 family protein
VENRIFPKEIKLHKKSQILEILFSDESAFKLPFEFLRVYSPSAEVTAHGATPPVLQTGKQGVDIVNLEPVGNYAIKPIFSDGHITGIYSWEYLYKLGSNQEAMWQDYLSRLNQAGASREPSKANHEQNN